MVDSVKDGVQQVVDSIYERDGEVKASTLVEEARPEESPAHDGFEWRDNVAAEEFRLIQARKWVRVCTVSVAEKREPLVHVTSVDRGEGYYKPPSAVVQIPSEFERALRSATDRLHSARRAVEELQRVAESLEGDDRAALIAQVARGLELMESALDRAVH